MNKHQPDHADQPANDNVIAFPPVRRVRPVEEPRFEMSGFWWTASEWAAYEAHVRENFGFRASPYTSSSRYRTRMK
jgi:hypothetical protein